MGQQHHFCSNNVSRTLPSTWRPYKNRSLQSITTPRYYCNVIISNVGDIRKPCPLFRSQNDPKISVYSNNGSETFLNTRLLYMNGLPQSTVTNLYQYKEIILNMRIFRTPNFNFLAQNGPKITFYNNSDRVSLINI